MKFGLADTIIERIQKVFEDYPKVDEALVFGSRAKGNYREDSDIDLAVKGKKINFDDVLKLSGQLDELSLPYKIDLVDYATIKDRDVVEHIDRVGIVFYERWKKQRFSDFVVINPSVSLNSNKEYSFIEMKDLQDGNKFCFPRAERKVSSGARFKEGDTLFARITPCLENGKICKAKGLKDGVGFGSTEFLVFRGKENISDNDFVFYLSRWDEVREFAERNFEGTSGRQRVPKDCFDNLFLNFPPLVEQQSIASILSSLDDKIDLLQRQSKTLEQLAETIFRKWFVLDVKEDWKERSLFDAVELVGGGTPKTEVPGYWDGTIKWISGKDITSNYKKFILVTEKTITKEGLENSSAKLLDQFSTVISARGTVGKYCLLSEPMAFSQSNYGIRPKIKNCFFFTYLLIAYCVEELQAAAYGSVFDTITTNTFKEQIIKLPSEGEIQSFEGSITHLFTKMLLNTNQIKILAQLRDTFLPKLMSGEVRVRLD